MIAGYGGLMWEQKKRNWLLGLIAALLAGLLLTWWFK